MADKESHKLCYNHLCAFVHKNKQRNDISHHLVADQRINIHQHGNPLHFTSFTLKSSTWRLLAIRLPAKRPSPKDHNLDDQVPAQISSSKLLNDACYKALTNESTQEMLKETRAKPEHKEIIDELRGQLSIPEKMTPEFVDEFRKYVVELCARELVPLYDSTTRSWKELPKSIKLEVQDLREIAKIMQTRQGQSGIGRHESRV